MTRFKQMSGLQRALTVLAILAVLTALALTTLLIVSRHNRQTVINNAGQAVTPAEPDDAAPLAPIGDSRAARTGSAVIYTADSNYLTLVSLVREITVTGDVTTEEAVVEEVLHLSAGNGYAAVGASDIKLLSVEKSMNIVTVNLSIDARRLDAERMHILRAAIVNSLLELSGIKYVNVLINGCAEPVDKLPTGAMTRFGNDLNTTWLQAQAEEQKYADNIGTTSDLKRVAAVYFGGNDSNYILPEAHSLRIDGSDYISAVLNELFGGPTDTSVYSRLLPTSADCLRSVPEVVSAADGNKVAVISFNSSLNEYLRRNDIAQDSAYGSIVRSICCFVPEVEGIIFDVDGITVIELTDAYGNVSYSFEDGIMRRSDFDGITGAAATLYYPSSGGEVLVRRSVPVSRYYVDNPRQLLNRLMDEPADAQSEYRAVRAMPDDITDADILGIRVEQNQVLINLSGAFYNRCQNMQPQKARAMVYSMVNTMCELPGIKSVRLYFDGERVDYIAQSIYVKGALMPNPGIVRD